MGRYTSIWAFEVRADRVEEFLRHYGCEGTWAELFRCAPGYLGTRLLRDRVNPLRFVTVDEWISEEAYASFRAAFEDEYQALDRECAALTVSELPVGQFSESCCA